MRKIVILIVGLVFVGALAWGQHFYAVHYSRAGGQDLEISLCNTTGKDSSYTIRAYDPWGKPLWEATGVLRPHNAAFHLIGNQVPEKETNWGVLVVDSQEPLVLGLEYSAKGRLHSVDIVSTVVPAREAGTAFQVAGYYSQVPDSFMALAVMNPWDQAVSGRLVVYKSDGSVAYQGDISLAAYESNSYSLAKLVGEDVTLWGLVEVVTDGAPVVMAAKLLIGGVLQVKNVIGALRVVVQPAAPTPPRKV
ncbi:MAG: hypothetical protein NUV94_07225 [Candidatus Acetothermia bacterium]|jgi:hypothetical protein|nr:hypothetical protein [Candidatus Acetothermia bacterium]